MIQVAPVLNCLQRIFTPPFLSASLFSFKFKSLILNFILKLLAQNIHTGILVSLVVMILKVERTSEDVSGRGHGQLYFSRYHTNTILIPRNPSQGKPLCDKMYQNIANITQAEPTHTSECLRRQRMELGEPMANGPQASH